MKYLARRVSATKRYVPLIDLGLIADALQDATSTTRVVKARQHLADLVRYRVGELIEYKPQSGRWTPGIIVAFMVHQPSYVCGPGDDREGTKVLLGVTEQYVRPRRAK